MSNLTEYLIRHIHHHGPITIAQLMAEALSNPTYGYYMKKDPFGKEGDFITAPEISQVFGELLGAWIAHCWHQAGSPKDAILVEMGPGRGTLMSDILRATKTAYGFHQAISVHMIETSPVLTNIQKETLKSVSTPSINWHTEISSLPEKPLFLIANELVDALPIHQYVKTPKGFREKMVTITTDHKALCFALSPDTTPITLRLDARFPYASDDDVVELCPIGEAIISHIAHHIATHGGTAILIDYGYARHDSNTPLKETLQAVRSHAYHPVLQNIGDCDLTAHVDFSSLKQAAEQAGAKSYGPIGQGYLLRTLGIETRAKALLNNASLEQQEHIVSAVRRLVSDDEMGTLFKAIALTHPTVERPVAF